MADAVQFVFRLMDQASRPAKSAGGALAEVERQLRAVNRASKLEALEKAQDPIKKARIGLQLQRDALKEQAGATQNSSGSLLGMGAAMGVVSGIAGALVSKMLEVGSATVGALGSAVTSAISYASEMALFKENTLFALKYATGSASAATQTLATAGRIASTLGLKTTDVAGQMQALLARGYGVGQAGDIVKAVADLKVMNPAANTDMVVDALNKMKMGGTIDPREIKELFRGGVNTSKLYENLADALHIKASTEVMRKKLVDAALQAGKLKGDEGQAAILKTIQQQGGGGALGSVAKAFADTTVTGSINRVQAQVEELFLAINASPVGKQIGRLFGAFADAIGPTTTFGKAFLGVVNDITEALGKAFGRVDTAMVKNAFTTLGNVIKTVWPYLKALGSGLWDGLKAALGPLLSMVSGMKSAQSPSQNLIAGLRALGEAAGFVIGAFVVVSSTMAMVTAGVLAVGTTLAVAFGSMVAIAVASVDAFTGIGTAIVDGLWAGITGAWGAFLGQFQALVALLPASVRGMLGIASPSKVFAEIGGYTAEGFAMGVTAGTPEVQGAVLSMVDPKVAATARGGSQTSVSTGGNSIVVNVSVAAGKDPQATAQATADTVAAILARLFETTAVEAGALGAAA